MEKRKRLQKLRKSKLYLENSFPTPPNGAVFQPIIIIVHGCKASVKGGTGGGEEEICKKEQGSWRGSC